MVSSRTRTPVESRATEQILGWPVHLTGLIIGLITAVLHAPRQAGDDWASLWIAGVIARDGQRTHLYDHHPEDFAAWFGPVWEQHAHSGDFSPYPHPFVQLPLVAELLSPLTRVFSFNASLLVLTVASGWALAVLIASAWHLWVWRTIPTGVLIAVATVTWLSVPFQDAIHLGQTTPLVLAAVAYALAAAVRHPTAAGIILAAATAVKLSPILLVVLFLAFRRTRRAGWRAVGAGAVLGAVSLVTAGWGTHVVWVERLREISAGAVVAPASESISSLLLFERWERRWEEDGVVVLTVVDAPGWVTGVTVVVAVLLAGLVVVTAWRRRELAYELLTVGLFVVVTLTSGLVWTHYFLLLVVPVAGIVLRGSNKAVWVPVTVVAVAAQFAPLAGVDALLVFPGGGLYGAVVVTVVFCLAFLVPERRIAAGGGARV